MSPVGIGGAGVLGVGFETVLGTRVAPTKFIPIRSESITHSEDKQVLNPLRGVATASYVKRGYIMAEGDIELEATSDVVPYLLYAARTTPAKTGAGPYTYTFVPSSPALPTTAAGVTNRKTLSVQIDRAAQAFVYLGMSVTSFGFSIDAGDLIMSAHLMGLALDTSQAVSVPTFATFAPFGPGEIAISIPNSTPRTDIDTFNMTVNDNGTSENRVRSTGRGPAFIKWGEREVSGTFDHDFSDLTEYNAFNNNSFRTFRVLASHGAGDSIQIDLANIMSNNYPVNLGAMGDLVRASIDWRAVWQGSSEYTITVITAESIT